MDPVLLGIIGTLGGGVIAFLLRENSRLKKENWQLPGHPAAAGGRLAT